MYPELNLYKIYTPENATCQLERDLAAVYSITNDYWSAWYCSGYFEAADGRGCGWGADPPNLGFCCEACGDSAGPDQRIALVYLDHPPVAHTGTPWRDIARKMGHDIAGVLVIERAQKTKKETAHDLLVSLPRALWDGALPILFDESGSELSSFSPASPVLKSPQLRLLLPTNVGRDLADGGCWQGGAFPAFEAVGTAIEEEAARVIGIREAVACRKHCLETLADVIGHATKPYEAADLADIAAFFVSVFYDSLDIEGLEVFGDLRDLEQAEDRLPYSFGVCLDLAASASLQRFDEAANALKGACHVLAKVLKDNGLLLDGRQKMFSGEGAKNLAEFMKLIGADQQVKALSAGVPLEDVLV